MAISFSYMHYEGYLIALIQILMELWSCKLSLIFQIDTFSVPGSKNCEKCCHCHDGLRSKVGADFKGVNLLQMQVQLNEDKDLLQQDKAQISQDLKLFLAPVREKLLQFEQELKER